MAKKIKDYVTSREADKQRKAKKPGKRVSASGSTYFEYRLNRADMNLKKKLKLGGKLLNKNITLKDIFKGK